MSELRVSALLGIQSAYLVGYPPAMFIIYSTIHEAFQLTLLFSLFFFNIVTHLALLITELVSAEPRTPRITVH